MKEPVPSMVKAWVLVPGQEEAEDRPEGIKKVSSDHMEGGQRRAKGRYLLQPV